MGSWQDILFAAGSFVLLIALLPSVFSASKPAISTSLLTGPILIMFGFILYTLELSVAGVLTAVTGCVWLVLAYQKATQHSNK